MSRHSFEQIIFRSKIEFWGNFSPSHPSKVHASNFYFIAEAFGGWQKKYHSECHGKDNAIIWNQIRITFPPRTMQKADENCFIFWSCLCFYQRRVVVGRTICKWLCFCHYNKVILSAAAPHFYQGAHLLRVVDSLGVSLIILTETVCCFSQGQVYELGNGQVLIREWM